MASSLVLVLLVDNLPGIFLNKTLETIRPFGQKAIDIHQCDQATQPIVELVNRHMGKLVKLTDDANDFNSYLKISKHSLQEESHEAFHNLLENTVENSKSIEKQVIENRYVETEIVEEDDKSECDDPKIQNDPPLSDHFEGANAIPDFPNTVPFLVAIFETLQNVTAQTCGGTLVAPNWVLTAASCVNLLGSMYANSTNASSSYTVIANSSNPLSEGSAHNVTQVMLHPGGVLSSSVAGMMNHYKGYGPITGRTKTPSLALLRVEPAVRLAGAPMMQQEAADTRGEDFVAVYGWQLMKNETTNVTSMRVTSFSARALTPYECELQYGVTDSSGALCLSTASDAVANTARISSGGPVVRARGGALQLAAVALLGDSAPVVAASVVEHAAWLHKVLETTDNLDGET